MWTTIGHDWAVAFLQQAIASGRVAHAYLITGARSVGKTHLALDLAAALNCTGAEPPCGHCAACLKTAALAHPDVTLVQAEGGRIKIDQARELQHTLALSPFEGRWRVCIVTDFETATREASNALLKTLEEPPSKVVLVLTATDATMLLPTIISRCQVLALRPVPTAAIQAALEQRWQLPAERASLIARLAAGRMGWAAQAVADAQVLARREQQMNTLLELVQAGRTGKLELSERLSAAGDLMELIHVWETWWRDVLLLCSGCGHLVVNQDLADALQQVADQVGLAQARACLRSTEAVLDQLDHNANARLALDVLFLRWPRVRLVGAFSPASALAS
jgi:DNA polymerase-3 subunit delta'